MSANQHNEVRADNIARAFAERVRRVLGPKLNRVYWFGSRTRGDSSAESDYDFLVETKARISREERDRIADISVRLTGRHRVPFDVHYTTEARMNRDAKLLSPFRDAVLREGSVL
jgi:predicted nucleotidyltransferase